ncbi:MAG: Ni/Fe hydrogenase subunit alpha [Thermodesulfobacteriota bacterium]
MTTHNSIAVHHVTRIEGHGDITAEIKDGTLEQVRFSVVEAPRFFEAFLRGHHHHEVTHMASRICGICAVSHKCAALKATEAALGVGISDQTRLLRRLAYHGEVLSSHILHIYFLAGPDFFDVPSVFPLVEQDREMVRRAMRLKNLGYDLSKVVVGRHTHPIAMVAGGFTFVHQTENLEAMKDRIAEGLNDLQDTIRTLQGIDLPDLERETEYVSLTHPDRYAFYDGEVLSSDRDEPVSPDRYREVIEEYAVDYSTAKYARWNRPEYMTGALARFNNNYEQLTDGAKTAAEDLGLTHPCHKPFTNTIAQVVECVHCLEDARDLIDSLLNAGIRPDREHEKVKDRAGSGVGAVEAPRGILFHEYQYDEEGKCLSANMVIPTAQNLANLEADMRAYVPAIAGQSKEIITHRLEMLVRAYDPCISCSTHVIDLRK